MLKKSMDILDISAICKRYNMLLKNCFIENIYYANYYWLFKLRCGNNRYFLKIEPGTRLHLSKIEPRDKTIDKFTAFMRKHIRGRRITSVEQFDWERIIFIEIASKDRKYGLITEILPRGFLVLVDRDNNKILYANKYSELRDRVIKRGLEYKPPPSLRISGEYFEKLVEKLFVGKDLVRGIVKGWGLPGYIAEEIIFRAGLYEYKNTRVEEISSSDLDKLVDNYKSLINEVFHYYGYIVEYEGSVKLYTAYKPRIFEEIYDAIVRKYDCLDDAIDSYFAIYEKNRVLEKEKEKLSSIISSLENAIERQKQLIKEYGEKQKIYEELYNVLINNYGIVEKALECACRIREEQGWEYIVELCSNVSRVEKNKGLIYVVIDNHEIPVDIRLDVWKNIVKYKKLVGEYRVLVDKAKKHLDELIHRLNEVKNKSLSVVEVVSKSLRPRYWFEKYHWLITSNGFLVIGGRNADQNESIVKKYLEPNDIFLHAEIHGAPATILKTYGKKPDDKDIWEASFIAGCYSRAWREGFGYIDIFWVKGDQVSKKPPAGEYLGKGAFMIYGKKNYLRIRLELGIGIEEVCDPIYGVYQRVIISPPNTIGEKTIIYAIIIPGDTPPKKTAEEIYASFKEKLGIEKLGIKLQDLLDKIPGSSRIVKVSKGKKELIEC